jgi:hypothetical protein
MKRLCILIGVAFLLMSALAFADTDTLIDFTNLAADVSLSNEAAPTENEATLVDFSGVAGSSFDEQLRKQMKTSLAIENWEVQLASSSRTVGNQSRSFTREAMTRPDAPDFQGETMSGINVMGVRVHFPLASFNSYAVIKPPFEIPAYSMKTELQGDGELAEVQGDLGTKFDGFGVIKNVGVIKSVEATVYGSNFPNGFGIILKDQDEIEQNIFMDYLEFDGWKTLVWNNPNYISEVRNREIRKYPLYPKSEPFTKLVGMILYRDSMQEGGDIIAYIKDIKVTYDKAVLRPERDIDDEAIWGILSERQEARKAAELRRLGNLQVLRFLEQQKMHEEETE